MSTRSYAVVAVGAVALLVAGGLFASNMGFKLNYGLDSAGVNGSASGTQSLALPYNQQTSLVKASDLRADVNATVPNSFVQVSRFVKQTDGNQSYAGLATDIPNDFTLTPGEGYTIVVSQPVNYIIVGSHDPGLVINLDAAGTNGSATGTNSFAYPYHSTASKVSQLFAEIAAQGGPGSVVQISRFVRQTDGNQSYAGLATDIPNDFNLVPGESYSVVVANNVAYVPSHY
jgi:hypothetical protein